MSSMRRIAVVAAGLALAACVNPLAADEDPLGDTLDRPGIARHLPQQAPPGFWLIDVHLRVGEAGADVVAAFFQQSHGETIVELYSPADQCDGPQSSHVVSAARWPASLDFSVRCISPTCFGFEPDDWLALIGDSTPNRDDLERLRS